MNAELKGLRDALQAAIALLENLPHQHAKAGCPVCENIDAWKAIAAAPQAAAPPFDALKWLRQEYQDWVSDVKEYELELIERAYRSGQGGASVDARDKRHRQRDLAQQSGEHRADSSGTSAAPGVMAKQCNHKFGDTCGPECEVFSNELTPAQIERLAVLSEELGEVQQAIGKILRHGYESYNPVVDTGMTNRRELERECGDVYEAILMLCRAKDINDAGVNKRQAEKHESIKRWLHHQA